MDLILNNFGTAFIKPNAEDSFGISFAPLSPDEAYTKADDPANGAVVMMSGMVRNQMKTVFRIE